jgi:hypothetical protein
MLTVLVVLGCHASMVGTPLLLQFLKTHHIYGLAVGSWDKPHSYTPPSASSSKLTPSGLSRRGHPG